MKTLVNYALIRFQPFNETGEFANVGVLLCAPETGYWKFKLAPARFARVTDFFKEIDKKVYATAIKNFKQELDILAEQTVGLDAKTLFNFFQEITRERESLLRFSAARTLLCEKPEVELDVLFDRYIHRDFANKKYREDLMVAAIRQQFKTMNIQKIFIERKVHVGIREFKVPFATEGDNNLRLIKPLAFEQQTATELYEHGEKWLHRMKAVVKEKIAKPENILLPIETNQLRGDKAKAFSMIRVDLGQEGFRVVDFAETETVAQFARDLN